LGSLESLLLQGNMVTKLERNLFSSVKKLRHLDLSNNKLQSLDRQDLQELTSLEVLKISNNQLTTLPKSIFSRNAKLYHLDLSSNKLEDIDTYLFKSTRFLKDLNVSGNLIKELNKNTFSPTTRLKSLDLSRNQLQSLGPETFKSLEFLEYINLAHNKIVNISTDAFNHIFQVEIDLSFNRLTRMYYWSFHEVGNITKLNLSHNLLNDLISPIAFDQTDCAHLDLSYNLLQDISKFPISNLTGLRYLDISHNEITELNKKSFSEKKPMYELHTIDASFNNISQISGNIMERLRSIRYLNMEHNPLKKLTSSAFGNSPTLLELNLSHNNLTDIASGSIVGLISIRTLDLRFNKLKKMVPVPVALNTIHLEHNEINQLSKTAFPSLNSLLELYLDHNRISRLDEGTFSSLLALHTLSLSHNLLDDIPMRALKDLTSLQTLNLNGNKIQRLQRRAFGTLPIVFNLRLDGNNISSLADHSFEGMLQLLNLNLSSNNLVEVPPEAFGGLVSLRQLDLSHNQLNRFENKTRSAMEDLLSLEVGNFSHNKLSMITQKTFLNSPYIPYRLRIVDLSHNLIGILVNHFAVGLKKVEWLSLRNNIINEIMPNVLTNITQLKYLDLSHNKLRQLKRNTFLAPSGESAALKSLETIHLDNNKLTSLNWDEFDQLRSLSTLNVSSNKLEHIYPDLGRWMKRGILVDLSNNNLHCNCKQLPLLAWLDNLRGTYLEDLAMTQKAQQHLTNSSHGPKQQAITQAVPLPIGGGQLARYYDAAQLVSKFVCSAPESMRGKSITHMLQLAGIESRSNALGCDASLLDEADQMRRLKAPIHFTGAEPYSAEDSWQKSHLLVQWALQDQRLDIINFLILRARFAHPLNLGKLRAAATTENGTNLDSLSSNGGGYPAREQAGLVKVETPDQEASGSVQLVDYNLERVPYNERKLVLGELDPSQFHIVCITYEAGANQANSAADMLRKLNSTAVDGGEANQLIVNIISNYARINCASIESLLPK